MPGVFGLREARIEQIKNISTSSFRYWSESAKYGYFAGGSLWPGATISTTTRLDFSNEIASNPGSNIDTVFGGSKLGLSNVSYGYLTGYGPPSVQRLNFSNETISNPLFGLSITRDRSIGLTNPSYGYIIGGYSNGPNSNTISRLDFSNETVSDPGKNFVQGIYGAGSVSANSYGYFSGGFLGIPPPVTNVLAWGGMSRLDFLNETVSFPGKDIDLNARCYMAGASNNSYGYFGGGYSGGLPNFRSTISRLDFSNETVNDPGKNLPQQNRNAAGVFNNSYGYFGGGETPPGNVTSIIARLDFSNETVTEIISKLSSERGRTAGLSGGASVLRPNKTYGYFAGGYPYTCTITRLDFSNETVSDPGKNLPTTRINMGVVSNNSYGYFGGGDPGSISTITRLDFSNEVISDPGKNLPTRRAGPTGVFNNSYGYFGGGYVPPVIIVCTIERLDFSNETSNLTSNNLPAGRFLSAGVFNNSYGYFGGGSGSVGSPQYISTITRLDFSNETVFNPGRNLPSERGEFTAVSNNSYGYFAGGFQNPPVIIFCNIIRLDFSNETVNDTGKASSLIQMQMAGLSNNSYGYFGGGSNPYICTIVRLDFSNETVSDPGKNLPANKSSRMGLTNSN